MSGRVFLFDLDGVLVQPYGYRAAVRATINDFTQRMGLPPLAPEDHIVAIFEAQGITCEWDMIPITLAIILEAAFQRLGEGVRMDSLEQACDLVRAKNLKEITISYESILRSLGQYMVVGEAPADVLFKLCQEGDGTCLFPGLSGQGVLRDLFVSTRRPALSRTTHLFQTYVLGDQMFERAMQIPAALKTGSLLEQNDQPLLQADTRDRLLTQVQNGLLPAVYTARPSLPLGEVTERYALFVPEAEMALNLVGLQSVPLIGSGQMGELALHLGEPEDCFTKPSPYHALAAIAAACSKDRSAAMDWTRQVYLRLQKGIGQVSLKVGSSQIPARIQVHIFEDSPSGIRGVIEASHMLKSLGVQVDLKVWGISDHPEKREALENTGAALFEQVNQAVNAALEIL